MSTKDLVKLLRRWHISPDGELYCPQCWGKWLAQLDQELIQSAKADSHDGNLPWARRNPICCVCSRLAVS